MDTAIRVQILDEIDYILHSTNTHGKGMNSILLPAIGKATNLGEGKLRIQTC